MVIALVFQPACAWGDRRVGVSSCPRVILLVVAVCVLASLVCWHDSDDLVWFSDVQSGGVICVRMIVNTGSEEWVSFVERRHSTRC